MVPFSRASIATAAFALTAACTLRSSPASASGIIALSPHPNEHLATSPPVIAAQLPPTPYASIGRYGLRVVVDGRDVSDALRVAGIRVEYRPSSPLSPGEHAVEITAPDAAGGRLTYSWTFTIDAAKTKAATAAASGVPTQAVPPDVAPSDGAAGSNDGSPPDESGAAAVPPATYQQNNYVFSPIGAGPYYWGDRAAFEFSGIPGGYGFVTFGGIPGVFDLLPLGFNTFYVIVPIPIGFIITSPIVTCHFFAPNGSPTISTLPSFPIVRHRRTVATQPLHVEPVAHSVAFAGHASMRRSATTRRGALVWRSGSRQSLLVHQPVMARRPLQRLSLMRPVVHSTRTLR
ncbi:MAG: hypothetical protein JO060_02370 [Candidatus Eremiobacteraeota bacterium]|nr:hypothetical protein [Candidatus Eremiobacteraeota bacterium]MBV9648083.1 hypothetical protein [Candidatus Eremiobacteraeota bacterium]